MAIDCILDTLSPVISSSRPHVMLRNATPSVGGMTLDPCGVFSSAEALYSVPSMSMSRPLQSSVEFNCAFEFKLPSSFPFTSTFVWFSSQSEISRSSRSSSNSSSSLAISISSTANTVMVSRN
ncbi:hypothetical protein KC19_VG026000 [Ceratodon purpureus]|uniref:Uncharacterized protein n=1 Tax=Ceratodon purpureus TaxID=3225 RepID=A0A8T0HLA5_CERPU|nr:hypothetical protein KC19_VG026000 [Ceratodon purpureus]